MAQTTPRPHPQDPCTNKRFNSVQLVSVQLQYVRCKANCLSVEDEVDPHNIIIAAHIPPLYYLHFETHTFWDFETMWHSLSQCFCGFLKVSVVFCCISLLSLFCYFCSLCLLFLSPFPLLSPFFLPFLPSFPPFPSLSLCG